MSANPTPQRVTAWQHCSVHEAFDPACSPCVAVRSLKPHWRCVRCGYLALSSPFEDFTFEDGTEATTTHACPACGDSYWKFAGDREGRSS